MQRYGIMIKFRMPILISLLLIIFTIVCGCTSSNDSEKVMNSVTPPQTEIPSSTLEKSSCPQRVSWPDVSPPYDENTKQKLVDFAKEEIVRVFPDVDESTLIGQWGETLTESIPPDIIFCSVNVTSEKHILSTLKRSGGNLEDSNIFVEIRVNSKTGEITSYKPDIYVVPSYDESLVSFEYAENKSLEFLKKVKGDNFFDEFESEFFIDKGNEGRGVAFFARKYSYNGVDYPTKNLCIRYDQGEDAVVYYSDNSKDYQLLKELTTLSPEPSISFNDAKSIFENKISEVYPGEDFKISYLSYGSALTWDSLDDEQLYAENPEPVKLVWHVYFNDEDMRKEHSGSITVANIDAHTGEILGLRYRDIIIPPYTEEEIERMIKSNS